MGLGMSVPAKAQGVELHFAVARGQLKKVKALLAAGAEINKADQHGYTPLRLAVVAGQLEVVKLLLAAGAEINKADQHGYTPLRSAVVAGQLEVVKLLLAAGAEINKADDVGTIPLHRAVTTGNLALVKILLAAGAKVNKASDSGETPLHHAAYEGHTTVVQALLVAGANVEAVNNRGNTAFYAAAANGQLEVVQVLLAVGAEVNKARDDGEAPLHFAAANGHLGVVQALLAAGADINRATNEGETPLHSAAYKGHTAVVQALLVAGANVEAFNNRGTTAFYNAAASGQLEVVQVLLAAGADINRATNEGETPLHSAAYKGHTAVVQALLVAGANVEAVNNRGNTAFYAAAVSGQLEVVQALLAAGAEVNKTSQAGCTPLHLAAVAGQLEVVKLLLTAGADINRATNNNGETPLHNAAYEGHTAVVQALLVAGANVEAFDNYGNTAFCFAAFGGHQAVMQIFAIQEQQRISADCIQHCLADLSATERATLISEWKTIITNSGSDGDCSQFIALLYSNDNRPCLLQTPEYHDPTSGPLLRQAIGELLQALPSDPALRASCNAYALEATSSCIDKVILAFRDCVKAVKLAALFKSPTTLSRDKLISVGSALFNEEQLKRIIQSHLDDLNSQNNAVADSRRIDEVEEQLAFLTLLAANGKVALLAPVFRMRFRNVAHVTDEQLVAAQNHLLQQAEAHPHGGAAIGLAASEQWRAHLNKQDPTLQQHYHETVEGPAQEALQTVLEQPQLNSNDYQQQCQTVRVRLEQQSQQWYSDRTSEYLDKLPEALPVAALIERLAALPTPTGTLISPVAHLVGSTRPASQPFDHDPSGVCPGQPASPR